MSQRVRTRRATGAAASAALVVLVACGRTELTEPGDDWEPPVVAADGGSAPGAGRGR